MESSETSWVTWSLVVLWGSSTWICVNCVWVELPLLVGRLEEGWNLPSYLAVIIQLATVGPIAYGLAERWAPGVLAIRRWLIGGLVGLGALCLFLLAGLWEVGAVVGGAKHSVALFVLFFFLSLVCTTSNVLFLPFMASFRPRYLTAFFIGMGVSALVPSVLSLAQGAGLDECLPANASDPASPLRPHSLPANFSVRLFFGLIGGWMLLAKGGFVTLMVTEGAVVQSPPKEEETKEEAEAATESTPVMSMKPSINYSEEELHLAGGEVGVVEAELSFPRYLTILGLVVWVNVLMNGFLPAIQSFSCLPYGKLTYHLAVVFSNIANPIACFVPHFVKVRGDEVVTYSVLTGAATALSGYIVALAGTSPEPLLKDSVTGAALCVAAWTIDFGVLAYLRAVMAGSLRERSGAGAVSQRRLFWYGAATQAGALLGSLAAFLLVNVATGLFTPDYNPCD